MNKQNLLTKIAVTSTACMMVLIAGCTGKQEPEVKKETPEQKAIERTKEIVKNGLSDPESAQFKSMGIKTKEGTNTIIAVCGEVNAKNKMGGYVGFTKFVMVKDRGLDIAPVNGRDQAYRHDDQVFMGDNSSRSVEISLYCVDAKKIASE